ncbi:MAG: putative lipid II flippase FtsW [Verrucomicrobia bacterium]|nr:putative lipid II flippase FtsW [Verrucomicrobiota bacterium]
MERERLLILLIVTLLMGIGFIMILNLGAYHRAPGEESDGRDLLRQQALWAALGLIAFAVASRLPYAVVVRFSPFVLVGVLGLLVLTHVGGIGVTRNGASRWVRFGPLEVQPAEMAKYALIIYFAGALARRQRRIDRPGSFVLLSLPLAAVGLLIIKQPDLSTTLLIACTTGLVFFCAGVPVRYLAGSAMLGVPFVVVKVLQSKYQLMRILALIDPLKYRFDYGYQQYQSLIALGSGGPFGVGLAASHQKLGYLTYAYNDFIAAIIGEEFGFLGICAVLLLYTALVLVGFRIAFRTQDLRGTLLAAGISSLIGLQAIIHIGVVSSTLPATGLNLPFVSFGGSNLFMNFIGLGILLNVSRATERVPRHQHGLRIGQRRLARA